MRKIIAIGIFALFLITACTPTQPSEEEKEKEIEFGNVTTIPEAYNAVVKLDNNYNTSYRVEMTNKRTIPVEKIKKYQEGLERLNKTTHPANESSKVIINNWYGFREKLLQSQVYFITAWVDIGQPGRVTDGFKCSEFPQVQNATNLFEKSVEKGLEATSDLDTVLNENKWMREKIGLNDEKPAIYSSDFTKIESVIRSNVGAMKGLCNKTVNTINDYDINGSEARKNVRRANRR